MGGALFISPGQNKSLNDAKHGSSKTPAADFGGGG
jgi:hypothetical protein